MVPYLVTHSIHTSWRWLQCKVCGETACWQLIKALWQYYTIVTDWKGELYCSITLSWNYDKRILDIVRSGYIKVQLKKYKHLPPPSHIIIHTNHNPKSMARQRNILSPKMPASLLTTRGRNKYRRLLAAYHSMHEQLISLSVWPSAPLLESNPRQQRTQKERSHSS